MLKNREGKWDVNGQCERSELLKRFFLSEAKIELWKGVIEKSSVEE